MLHVVVTPKKEGKLKMPKVAIDILLLLVYGV